MHIVKDDVVIPEKKKQFPADLIEYDRNRKYFIQAIIDRYDDEVFRMHVQHLINLVPLPERHVYY